MSNKINNYFQKKGRGRQELTPFTSDCLLPPCLIYRETHVTASLLFFFFTPSAFHQGGLKYQCFQENAIYIYIYSLFKFNENEYLSCVSL